MHRQSASLQAWEGTALMITIQVDECFSGGHPDFAPAPLRHDLMVLAPNPLSVLADVCEQRGLLCVDDGRDVHVRVRLVERLMKLRRSRSCFVTDLVWRFR